MRLNKQLSGKRYSLVFSLAQSQFLSLSSAQQHIDGTESWMDSLILSLTPKLPLWLWYVEGYCCIWDSHHILQLQWAHLWTDSNTHRVRKSSMSFSWIIIMSTILYFCCLYFNGYWRKRLFFSLGLLNSVLINNNMVPFTIIYLFVLYQGIAGST